MPDLNPRRLQESWEDEWLAPWAARSAHSRGRDRPEDPDPVRTAFQRDRDRVIHSKAFRRLKHKTQVFIEPEEDHFRTRLTHTLEVSQVARTIARALRLNEDLTEAIALAHDLGHAPFGHAGEEALNAAYRAAVPGASFRHDRQSLRVVEVLETRRDGPGLNLTWEVRDGIAHHSKGRRAIQSGARAATLEGQVVRISDRIAYLNHDLDDAIRARMVTLDDIPAVVVEVLGATHSARIGTMVMDVIGKSHGRPEVTMSPPVARASDILKEFLYENVYMVERTANAELRKAQQVVAQLFKLYLDQPELMEGEVIDADETFVDRAQRVCDFVSGMTDRYAVRRFVRHFLPHGLASPSDR